MSRYDKDEAPYRQEYSSSYFESGFQRNDESTTSDIVGNGSQEPVGERIIAGVYNYPKTDVTAARDSENVKKEGDSFTVLSGD